jgi:hypothetical protein
MKRPVAPESGRQGFPSLGIASEHVRLRRHVDVAGLGPLVHQAAVLAQTPDGHIIER